MERHHAKIFNGDELITEVDLFITIVQDRNLRTSWEGSFESKVTALTSAMLDGGRMLMMELDDGRKGKFILTGAQLGTDHNYRFQGTGPLE